MTTYKVTWIAEIEANSATEAAEKALLIQRNPYSIATMFEVQPEGQSVEVVDLSTKDVWSDPCIFVTGNPVDGFTFEGPYPNMDAIDVQDVQNDWWVAPIQEPRNT